MDWFTRDEKALAIVHGALEAASKFGEILEAMHRDSVMLYDTTKLPLPKSAMKIALKIAWQAAPSDELRNAAEGCFLFLSHFQDGIGNAPVKFLTRIDAKTPPALDREASDSEPRHIAEVDRLAFWQQRSVAETITLGREFDEFKKQQLSSR